jgi:putative restriction endonuclease
MIDDPLRSVAFSWLKELVDLHGEVVTWQTLLAGFEAGGKRITLAGPAGIWKPRGFELPLSITSVYNGPYDDGLQPDGLLVYRYRGTDPAHPDNVGLREAGRTRTPLIYFHGIMEGRYIPVWPVTILEDRPEDHSCLVAVEHAYGLVGMGSDWMPPEEAGGESILGVRRYIMAAMRLRLHQASFRERVIAAYGDSCALCRLRHRELLDAAHIVPDSRPKGDPVVPNGLSLCKIHHAAYDQNILGISPDYIIHVRDDILEEIDGPMLQHGLKGLHREKIVLPRRRIDRPDRERLEWRFGQFRRAV